MKKKPYYLEMYEEWTEKGRLPQVPGHLHGGLCGAGLVKAPDLELLRPTAEERRDYNLNAYWADGLRGDCCKRVYTFTPFRQTIVLFLAAMNDEL